MDFDNALESVGSYGKFQVKVLLTSIAFGFPSAFNLMVPVFLHYTPEHHCKPDVNVTYERWLNKSIQQIETDKQGQLTHSSCKQYNVTANTTHGCANGWVFVRDQPGLESVVTEFNIVCEKLWILPLISSWFLGIKGVNLLITGYFSDRFGRKLVIFSALIIEHFVLLLVTFSPTVWWYAVLIVIYSATGPASYITCYSLISELTGPEWRNKMNMALNCGFMFGYMSMPLMAYCFPNWRSFMRCILLCGILYIPIFWIFPESPRWLFSRNRVRESVEILHKISIKNGTNVNKEDILGTLESLNTKYIIRPEESSQETLLDVFRNKKFAIKVLTLALTWAFINIAYFGLALNTSSFAGDRFLNCFWSAVTEIPATFLAYISVTALGRPWTITLTLLAEGILCIASPLFKSVNVGVSVALAISGKAASSGCFYAVIGYTAEISPTLLRSKISGFCNACSKVAAFITPYIMVLGMVVDPIIPYCVMGIGAILSAVLAFLNLPETKDVDMPETIDEANKMKPIIKRCK